MVKLKAFSLLFYLIRVCRDREKVSFFVENDQADEFTLKHFVVKYFLSCFKDSRLYLTLVVPFASQFLFWFKVEPRGFG